MVKFILLSFLFHITLLVLFKLDVIDLKNNKEKSINVNLAPVKKEKPIVKPSKNNKKIKTKEAKKEKKPNKKEKVNKKQVPKKVSPISKKKKEKQSKEILEKNNKEINEEKKFDDLLKNLADEKLPSDNQDNFNKTLKKLSEEKLLNKTKTNKNELSEIQKLLLLQINSNWSRPPGIKFTKDLSIRIIITLDINGKVFGLQIHDKTKHEVEKNNALEPYLESAIRAIKKSSPFEGLRKDRYNIWKEIIINFKPVEAM